MPGSSAQQESFDQSAGLAQFNPLSEVQIASELRRVNEELSEIVGRMAPVKRMPWQSSMTPPPQWRLV